jgi:hypothetical protein
MSTNIKSKRTHGSAFARSGSDVLVVKIGARIVLLDESHISSTYQDNLIEIFSPNHSRYFFIVRVDKCHRPTSIQRFSSSGLRAKLSHGLDSGVANIER